VSKTIPIAAAAAVVLLVGVVYTTTREPASSSSSEAAAASTGANDTSAQAATVAEPTAAGTDTVSVEMATAPATAENTAVANHDNQAASLGSLASVTQAIEFAQSLAQVNMNDAAIIDAANKMRQDPALLAATLDEFAGESDPDRLNRLRLLLGQLEDESMVEAAEAMVYSGNPASTKAGLELLRDISPDVPAAKNVALDVLSSTQDAQTLISATQVIGSPDGSSSDMRGRMVGTLTALVQHQDAKVRRGGYAALARWSTDSSITPTVLQGLSDPDSAVRKSTAYGLVGYPYEDAAVVEALLLTAENSNEIIQARRGSLLALKRMTLDDTQRARMVAAEASL